MQGCQIFLGTTYQNGKNTPNDHKMHQTAVKCTNKTLQNLPKMFWVWCKKARDFKVKTVLFLNYKGSFSSTLQLHEFSDPKFRPLSSSSLLETKETRSNSKLRWQNLREKIFFTSDQNHQERENFPVQKSLGATPSNQNGAYSKFRWQDFTILIQEKGQRNPV
jgi:hypothetical protein